MKGKALVAMSGGVDSSVAAYLTKAAGWEVVGVTMKLFSGEGADGVSKCCSLDDVEDAKSVARRLSVPHYVFNLTDRFRSEVMDRFVSDYEKGRTPNPCIECNRRLKFGELFRRARELGCDRIVTGHYARVVRDGERCFLKKAVDPAKDQSYVLYSLPREVIPFVDFPLGGMSKDEVRGIASELGFVNAEKRDSQDICFIPNGKYGDFIESYTGRTYPPGDFVDRGGKVLGAHRGIIRYTTGQRRGLGLALPEPLYVCGVDVERNRVILGRDGDLYSRAFYVGDLSFTGDGIGEGPVRLKVKVRYRQPEKDATLRRAGDAVRVEFDEPVRAITPGQAAVFYDGDTVVGGGTITEREE